MRRVCSQCGKELAQKNPAKLCFACQEKRRERDTTRNEELIDAKDFAFILGLTNAESVKRLALKGKLPPRIPGVRKCLWSKEVVDLWIHSAGKITKPELLEHYSELAINTLKLVEILEYYFKTNRSDIEPLISTDFPLTLHLPDSPILSEREFSNLMDHLKGEIPELASISEYPSACKRYFTGNNKAKRETPTATITGDLILKLKQVASQGQFPGRCPDCPS
jgi:hypothetical protein